jgi:predicted DNA-binding transcriptional regulator YafY
MFSATEALGLVMAVLDGHHDAGDESEPVGAALGKVVRALPAPVAEQVQAIRRTTAPAPDRGAARPDPATTIVLVQACSGRRRVRLRYRSEAGTQWVTEAEPWAVVVRHGRWYLLCRAGPERVVRAYRLDRMHDVQPLDELFEPPPNLDPVAALEAHLAAGWEYAVDVVVEAPADRVRRILSPALGRLEAISTGSTRLTGTTGNPFWYAEQLATLPHPFHVAGGPELRHTVAALGRRLLAASPG